MVGAHNTQEPLKTASAIPGIENNEVDADALNKKLADLQLAHAARNVDNKSVPSSPTQPKVKAPNADPLHARAISTEPLDTGETVLPAPPDENHIITVPGLPGENGVLTLPGLPGETGNIAVPGLPGENGTLAIPGLPGETGNIAVPGLPGENGVLTLPGLPGETGNIAVPGLSGETGGITVPGITSTTAEKSASAETSGTVDQAVSDTPDAANGLDETATQ